MISFCIMSNARGGGVLLYPDHWKEQPFAVVGTKNGRRMTLCKKHLDLWLDLADDRAETEPTGLWFL